MIKKLSVLSKLLNKKKTGGNCCSFEIEEIEDIKETQQVNNKEKENKCCFDDKKE